MNIFKLTLVAAALTIGSGAAYADNSRAPQLTAVHVAPMTVAMTRSIEIGSSANRATIFGHSVSVPDTSTETVQVWGHALDR